MSRILLYIVGFKIGHNALHDECGASMARALFKPNEIVVLDMSFCEMGKKAMLTVFDLLESNTSLTELNVSGNATNKDGIRALTRALKTNKTLLKLGLRHCDIAKVNIIPFICQVSAKPSIYIP